MRLYLGAVINRESGGMRRLDPMGHIVFRAPHLYPEVPPAVTNATPEFAECLRLEARMLRDMANWRDPASRIEQILNDLLAKNILKPRDFSPSYFAALVARFAIGDNDWNTALRLLRLGLVFSGQDEQLLYLSRVLDRIIPQDMLEKFRKEDAEKHPNL